MKDARPSVSESAPRETDPGRAPGEGPAAGVEQLRRELDEKHDRYLRALAEVENVKRRARGGRDGDLRYSNETLVRDLLPVVAHFDRGPPPPRQRGEAPPILARIQPFHRPLLK